MVEPEEDLSLQRRQIHHNSALLQPLWVGTNQYPTLLSLADVAIIFHLTGPGSPHPSVL